MDITRRINAANGRLKAGKIGIKIEARCDRLNLRTTLPPKPDSDKLYPHQQRIALDIRANIAGVPLAEAEARKVRYLLDSKTFSWDLYLKPEREPCKTVADWVKAYEDEYFSTRARTPKTETTWKMNYIEVFNRLPQNSELTYSILKAAILKTQPDTRMRQKVCWAYQRLATLAGMECDLKSFAGNYSPKSVTPRDLPSDDMVEAHYHTFKDPAWQWIYGMLATFGLRPHEVFFLDTTILVSGGYHLEVLQGKTSNHKVWALHPAWVDKFNLRSPSLPNISGKTHRDLGQRIAQHFRRYSLPFKPYDLRHAWAVRSIAVGLSDSLAAQQMGHSLRIHSEIYHHWISDRHHQKAYEEILQRLNTTSR